METVFAITGSLVTKRTTGRESAMHEHYAANRNKFKKGMALGIVPFFIQDERTGKHFLQTDAVYGKLGLYIQDDDKAMA